VHAPGLRPLKWFAAAPRLSPLSLEGRGEKVRRTCRSPGMLARISSRFFLTVVGLTVLASGGHGLAATSAVRVEAPGITCPAVRQVEAALAARGMTDAGTSASTPTLLLEKDHAPPTDFPLASAPAGSESSPAPRQTLVVALRDAAGATLWTRLLDPADDCDGAAEVLAVMVSESLRPRSWDSSLAAPRALPATHAGRPRWALGAGLAFLTRAGARPSLMLEGRVRLVRGWGLGASAFVPSFSTDETIGQGHARLDAWPATLAWGWEGANQSLFGAIDAEGLFTYERAETTGLASTDTATRLVASFGAAASGGLALSPRSRLRLRLGAHRAALGRSFRVQGAASPVLEPPVWQAAATLSLEFLAIP